MAEQYIYSRSEREFTNSRGQKVSLGFGFVALSPGMNTALKDAVTAHCADCPRVTQVDGQGVPLPLLRKARLPKGQVMLQKSAWIEEERRDFQVAHGYVLEQGEAMAADPAKWFTAPFQLGNPNAAEDEILLDSLPGLAEGETFCVDSLMAAMGIQGLGKEQFCGLLLACFDALASRRKVLIACDFSRPRERESRASVLYWIYTCLPWDLRAGLGFDSVYTGSSPEQVHIAFVDKASIRAEGQFPSIQLENRQLSLDGNFLVLDGTIIHNDRKYKTDWYGGSGIYARWLEQAVDTLWNCPEESLPAMIQGLADFYWSFQEQLNVKEQRLDPQWYDAICERTLSRAPQALAETCERVRRSITEEEVYDCRLTLMDWLKEEDRQVILTDILQSRQKHGAPVRKADVKMLCILFESGLKASVTDLLSALMAEETDAPGAEVTSVMSRYQEMLPPELYSALLERLFFGQGSGEDAPFWKRCGVESGEEASARRRSAWFAERIPVNVSVWELPAVIGQALGELKGLNSRQKAEFWQGPFQERCRTAAERDLESFMDDSLPQRLHKLEQELSSLPGGAPKDGLDMLRQEAYRRLLAEARPFIDKAWLDEALRDPKIGGETRETLEILKQFTEAARGEGSDAENWWSYRAGRSEAAWRRGFSLLPEMFLRGALPKIWSGFVVEFLHQRPEKRREILLQAAGLGGGSLLLDILNYARKYPRRLSGSEETDLLAVTRIVCGDPQIADRIREKDRKHTYFYSGLMEFLQEAETGRVLSTSDISKAMDDVKHIVPGGNGGMGRGGRSMRQMDARTGRN